MSNKGKPNLLHAVISALVTTIISSAVSIVLQWLSLESVVITVSPSSELEGKYLTIVSVQNLQKETLSELSLYFDTNFDILEITSEDQFEQHEQYIELESIAPKAKYSVVVWTEYPILNNQIISESNYKTRLEYSNDSSPVLLQMLWFIIPFGLITFVGTGLQIWIDWKHRIKESQKILKECDKLKKENEKGRAELQAQKDDLTQAKAEYQNINRKIKEMQSYSITYISQLRKELSFWRDTVRKLLYNRENEFQTADKVINTVTSTLKTYTTRKHSDEDMDQLLYLAQLIADSRELHGKHHSSD